MVGVFFFDPIFQLFRLSVRSSENNVELNIEMFRLNLKFILQLPKTPTSSKLFLQLASMLLLMCQRHRK